MKEPRTEEADWRSNVLIRLIRARLFLIMSGITRHCCPRIIATDQKTLRPSTSLSRQFAAAEKDCRPPRRWAGIYRLAESRELIRLIPHSTFWVPAQRPERSSSPATIARVQG